MLNFAARSFECAALSVHTLEDGTLALTLRRTPPLTLRTLLLNIALLRLFARLKLPCSTCSLRLFLIPRDFKRFTLIALPFEMHLLLFTTSRVVTRARFAFSGSSLRFLPRCSVASTRRFFAIPLRSRGVACGALLPAGLRLLLGFHRICRSTRASRRSALRFCSVCAALLRIAFSAAAFAIAIARFEARVDTISKTGTND